MYRYPSTHGTAFSPAGAMEFRMSGSPRGAEIADMPDATLESGTYAVLYFSAPGPSTEDYDCTFVTGSPLWVNQVFSSSPETPAIYPVAMDGHNAWAQARIVKLYKNKPFSEINYHDVLWTSEIVHVSKLLVKPEGQHLYEWRGKNGGSFDLSTFPAPNTAEQCAIFPEANDIPKTGLFAGQPEAVLQVLGNNGSDIVYQSEVCWNNKNPRWNPILLHASDFGDVDKFGDNRLKFRVMNHDGKKKVNTPIGESEMIRVTDVDGLIRYKLKNEKGKVIDTQLTMAMFSGSKILNMTKQNFANTLSDNRFSVSMFFDFKRFHSLGEEHIASTIAKNIGQNIAPFSKLPVLAAAFGGKYDKYDASPLKMAPLAGPHPICLNPALIEHEYKVARETIKPSEDERITGLAGCMSLIAASHEEYFKKDNKGMFSHQLIFFFLSDKLNKAERTVLNTSIKMLWEAVEGTFTVVLIPLSEKAGKTCKKMNALQYIEKEKKPIPMHCTVGMEFDPSNITKAWRDAMFLVAKNFSAARAFKTTHTPFQ